MKKVLIIGCAGAGKSTFTRKLAAKTDLPLLYLDMIWHRPDGTDIGRPALYDRLEITTAEDEWILSFPTDQAPEIESLKLFKHFFSFVN